MRRMLVVLFAASLLLTACGGEPEPEPTPSRTRATPSPTPEPELAPLTGEDVQSTGVLDRPVVAVKIDNASPARPQAGLAEADVVFEELVEGGYTRFLALFQSRAPQTAGPVRSGRDVEADLLPPYDPLFVISGAAEPTYAVLRGAGLKIREESQPEDAFERAGDRKRPYNLFVDVERMYQVASQDDGLPAASEAWTFAETAPSGRDVLEANLTFSPTNPVRWVWDDASGSWLREQAGASHVDVAGDQLAAENVVVLKVPVAAGGGVDSAGNATQHIQIVGSGEATVLRDGKAVTGTWRKQSRDGHIEFVTSSGVVIPLSPGRTWVELLPVGAPLDLVHPQPTGTASPTS